MKARTHSSALSRALQGYVDARNAALIQARRELRIGDLDVRALLFIAAHPGARPTQLRVFLGITSAGITTLIDRLVERGAVRRDVDPDDRRVNRITVTIDLAADPWSALTQFDTDFDGAVTSLDLSEADRFAAALERLTSSAATASTA